MASRPLDLEFVPFSREHFESCLALFEDNCPESFAANERDEYASFLHRGQDGYHVCLADGRVVGAFGVIAGESPARRRLNWILIGRASQSRGIGSAMMAVAVRTTRAQGADVVDIAASHKSAPFFARFGARETVRTADGWGPGMHRVDMELRVAGALYRGQGGAIVLPRLAFVDRSDGGHVIVNPPRDVWERSELSRDELTSWSMLVAATGRAMLDVLPPLAHGCINYWEAGNWALHEQAEPVGPKDPRRHRVVHMHLLGRSPEARDAAWRWGEAPRFPDFVDRQAWAARFEPLTPAECSRIVERACEVLRRRYEVEC